MLKSSSTTGRLFPLVLVLALGTGIAGIALSTPASAATKIRVDASWSRYGKSRFTLSAGSRDADHFRRWESDRSFYADANDGDLTFTVNNGYDAQWVLQDAYDSYYGTPEVVVDPRDNGDLYVTVTSGDGSTRTFYLDDGGLDAVYVGGYVPVTTYRSPRYTISLNLGSSHRHYYRPPTYGSVHLYSDHNRSRTWRNHDRVIVQRPPMVHNDRGDRGRGRDRSHGRDNNRGNGGDRNNNRGNDHGNRDGGDRHGSSTDRHTDRAPEKNSDLNNIG